jgi:hypothetical protein
VAQATSSQDGRPLLGTLTMLHRAGDRLSGSAPGGGNGQLFALED